VRVYIGARSNQGGERPEGPRERSPGFSLDNPKNVSALYGQEKTEAADHRQLASNVLNVFPTLNSTTGEVKLGSSQTLG
jgi:hypothetical protein